MTEAPNQYPPVEPTLMYFKVTGESFSKQMFSDEGLKRAYPANN